MTKVRHVLVPPKTFVGCVTFCTGYNPERPCWDSRPLNKGSTKEKLKEALRKSLRTEGFRNPIIAYSCERGLLLHYGGTRLRMALELGMEYIPVICYDSADLYPDSPEVTMDNYLQFFTDEPYFWIDHEAPIPLESHYGIRVRDGAHHLRGATKWLGDDPTGVIEDELLKVAAERRGEVYRS